VFSLKDKHLIKLKHSRVEELHIKTFTNVIIFCSDKMLIKCLIFIKICRLCCFPTLEFLQKNDLYILQGRVERLFRWSGTFTLLCG